nr:MAG TPA: holin [Caudoviricetes sp.]
MQETLIHFAEQHLYLHIVLIIFCTAAILIAMALDLFFGIRKAHERGQPTTSRGLKMTSRKAVKYLVPFLVLSLIDIIGSPLCAAPYFSMGWAAWCVLCEFRSIREKAWEKAEIERQDRTVQAIISEHDLSKMAKKFAVAVFDEAKNRDIVPVEKAPAAEDQVPENAEQ